MEKISNREPFSGVMNVLKSFPLWVLQGIYVEIADILRDKGNTLNLNKLQSHDLIQLFKPSLSKIGKKEIQEYEKNPGIAKISPAVYSFLRESQGHKNIIDIAYSAGLSIEQASTILLECISENYIEPTYSQSVHSTAMFLSGSIRIGEFLIRKNKITDSQLEMALKVQNDTSGAFDERIRIVEILINLGYVQKDEVQDYLRLKEIAKENIKISDLTSPYIEKIKELETELQDIETRLQETGKKLEITEQEKEMLKAKMIDVSQKMQFISDKNTELKNKVNDLENKSIFKKL